MNKFPYWFWDGQIDKFSCSQTIKQAEKIGFEAGVIGQQGNLDKELRNCQTAWLPRMHVVESILVNHALAANLSTGWRFDLVGTLECTQIAKYGGKGKQFYDTHNDLRWHESSPGMERKMTAVLLLSEEKAYEGGELWVSGEKVKSKKVGTVVVFPSFLPHKVTPVEKGVRYSATCWISGPTFR